jgi:hypothetical protein
MKLLLAIAILIPNFSYANPLLAPQLKGQEARRLWDSLDVEPEDGDLKVFSTPSLSIECSKAAESCQTTVENGQSARAYLYRSEEARRLYQALGTEEFEGRLGYTKIFSDAQSGFEIFCSRFYGAEGDNFSCSVKLGG